MALSAGQRLGVFEVVQLIGSGGMGEVYRARDTTLKRDVAIKVLPQAFTADAERLARFEREAQLLAQLNHTNIAAIHGVQESEGIRALVMELVEGPTLAERIASEPLPLEDCLAVARQIAEALEQAHAKGIIHRDLKPANIKLRSDGTVKVLDFGLAKAFDTAAVREFDPSSQLNSPTVTSPATMHGVILGTAAYMSPEQAKGVAVDRRTDIWSFGVVFYEMLVGQPLFQAPTVAETLAQVLTRAPDLDALPPATPSAIRQLVSRCLARNPRQRLHDIADARIVLDEVLSGAETRTRREPERTHATGLHRTRIHLAWLGAIVLAAAGAGLAGYFARGQAQPARQAFRLSLLLSPDQQLATGRNTALTFGPDGRSLILGGLQKGQTMLVRRLLGEADAHVIPGTDGAEAPFLSPDGRWIGFTSHGQLMKVATEGGRPFSLAQSTGAGGAVWLPDNFLVFAPMYSDGLFGIPADGGTAERLTTPDRSSGELGHWWPDALPGGQRIIFTAFRTPVDRSRIGVLDLATRRIDWVVEGGFFGRYAPSGHLVYAKGQRLFAVPFDAATSATTGPTVAVLDDVAVSQTGGFAKFAVSSEGVLAYVTETSGDPLRELVWLDRSGRAQPAVPEHHRYRSASLSPDGRHAAITIHQESMDLWTYSLQRGTLSRLTSGPSTEYDGQWSPDGSELFYVFDRPPFELHRIRVGAADAGKPIWKEQSGLDTFGAAVGPDGRHLAFSVEEQGTGTNLYVRPLDGAQPARALRVSKYVEMYATFSPDGRWIAYQSDETGRSEIYVEPFPGPGERVQISADGGTEPVWTRASGEIFFRRDQEFRVVLTKPGARFEFDAPRTLFSFLTVMGSEDNARTYDVTADGTRILAIRIPEISVPRRIEVVTDWTTELRRIAPAAK